MPSAYDLFFQLRKNPTGEQAVFTFAYQSARGVRGFQKTINQWLKCLMTRRGSDLINRTYGTEFTDLYGGTFYSRDDVLERVTLAVEDATEQILASQRNQSATVLPSDERLASVSVVSVEETGAAEFSVYVVLKNVLNQGVQYVLPTI